MVQALLYLVHLPNFIQKITQNAKVIQRFPVLRIVGYAKLSVDDVGMPLIILERTSVRPERIDAKNPPLIKLIETLRPRSAQYSSICFLIRSAPSRVQ